jgi:hypothetical protein
MRLQGLVGVISRFATETITITRPGAATFDTNGTATFGASSTLSTAAHVQRPAGFSDLAHLPEGDRVRRSCVVFAPLELRHRDVVTIGDGERYELQGVEPWGLLGGYWRAVGLKAQQ